MPVHRVARGADAPRPRLGGAEPGGDLGQRPTACPRLRHRRRAAIGRRRRAQRPTGVGRVLGHDHRWPHRAGTELAGPTHGRRGHHSRAAWPRRLHLRDHRAASRPDVLGAESRRGCWTSTTPARADRARRLVCRHARAWLLARLPRSRVTEVGNASRTQLLDLATGGWDPKLLEHLRRPGVGRARRRPRRRPDLPVTADLRPLPCGCARPRGAGRLARRAVRPRRMAAGGRQGHLRHRVVGDGARPAPQPPPGVCTTIAWDVEGIAHAREANIRSTGRTLTWLADLFGVDAEVLWAEAADPPADGVVLVPAFGGLGAPHWDRDAVPVLAGFVSDPTPALARAARRIHRVPGRRRAQCLCGGRRTPRHGDV